MSSGEELVTPPAGAAGPGSRPRRRVLGWLAVLGPGLIAANAGNDAGGIATYASAGAQFGYRTLFLMVLVTVGLVVVQEMSARLGAHTGEGLMSLIREQFPLRVAALPSSACSPGDRDAEDPAERIDTIAGSVFANLVSMAIIVATAATIGGRGPLGSATQAADALRPVAGHFAEALFGVGLLGASALAAAVVPLATAYAVAEAVGAERSSSRRFREAPLFVGLFSALVGIGAAVALAPGNLIGLVINMQVLNGFVVSVVLAFILVLANRRSVLGDAVNGRRFNVVATVSVVAVAILAGTVLFQTVAGWVG